MRDQVIGVFSKWSELSLNSVNSEIWKITEAWIWFLKIPSVTCVFLPPVVSADQVCYYSTSKCTCSRDKIFKLSKNIVLQWFYQIPCRFAEFIEFLFHLGKIPVFCTSFERNQLGYHLVSDHQGWGRLGFAALSLLKVFPRNVFTEFSDKIFMIKNRLDLLIDPNS